MAKSKSAWERLEARKPVKARLPWDPSPQRLTPGQLETQANALLAAFPGRQKPPKKPETYRGMVIERDGLLYDWHPRTKRYVLHAGTGQRVTASDLPRPMPKG